jgi:hypothetical protein
MTTSPPSKEVAQEGARLSNWLSDYTHDLMEDGFEQEAAEINRAAQWMSDRLATPAVGMQRTLYHEGRAIEGMVAQPEKSALRASTPAVWMREALIAAKLTSPDGTFVHASTDAVLAALRSVQPLAGEGVHITDAEISAGEEVVKAAVSCVSDYPIASGLTATSEGDGYGSLRELRLALEKMNAVALPPVSGDGRK